MNRSFIKFTLSRVIGIEAIFLGLVGLMAIGYKENVYLIYLIVAAIAGIIALYGIKKYKLNDEFFAKEGFISVALAWIVMSLIGAIPLRLTGEIPNYIDAVFEVVSGLTTTGSTIINDVTKLSHASLFWRAFTHWIGGMGILVFVLAIMPNASGRAIHVMRAESPGPSVGKLVSKLGNTAKILYTIYFFITVAEVICMLICGMNLFDSLCLSFATAGTGGFGVLNDSFVSYSSSVQIVATVFMILFGVNFNVYYFILAGRVKEALHSEEVRWYLIIIIASASIIAFNTLSIFGNILTAYKHSFFQVASLMTTTGFASYDFDTWPSLSKTILVVLMFIGACAGSTGGGLKVSRVVILVKSLKNSLRKYYHPREVKVVKFEEKVVDNEQVSSIRAYLAFFVAIFIISIILISIDNLDFATNFTAVAATINNIGPGLNLVGPMCNFNCFGYFSKIVLIFDMLAGRLELIPMLVLFMPLFRKD